MSRLSSLSLKIGVGDCEEYARFPSAFNAAFWTVFFLFGPIHNSLRVCIDNIPSAKWGMF